MLVLSRVVGEEIKIGDLVTIKVIEVRGGKVRIGIQAPKEVSVHRGEIWEILEAIRKQEQSDESAKPGAD